jgi:thioredoxin 1
MTLTVLCFFQPGCMGCMEQQPINAEISSSMKIAIDEIDVIKNPQYIGQYNLKATPTILIIRDGEEKERFEGVVFAEQLETVLKKYL